METVTTLKGLRCPACGSENVAVKGVKGAMGTALAVGLAAGAIGNLVAGGVASKDMQTEPMQYKCAGCGNKFVSGPLLAPPEDILSAPCSVTFERVGSFVGMAVPQIAYINGLKLGPVKNGKTIAFETLNRYNTMFVTDQYGMAFKGEYRFEAAPGGSVRVRFKRKFL